MSKPIITQTLSGFIFHFPEENIKVEATEVHLHKDRRITGFLKVDALELEDTHLHEAEFNFKSDMIRTRWEKSLSLQYAEDWKSILAVVCHEVKTRITAGEPVEFLDNEGEPDPISYLVAPLIPLGHPTVIYGEGDSGKGVIGLGIAMVAILPWYDNPLRLIAPPEPTRLLYLDWELGNKDTKGRLQLLKRGMGLPYLGMEYRRCSMPMADDIDSIQNIVSEKGISFIITDSLGMASGGDLNATEPAFKFYSALRKLNVTSLIIAHTQKGEGIKSIYGNVHFRNYARQVWQLKKTQDEGATDINLTLYHEKHNFCPKHPPIGFNIDFRDTSIIIKRVEALEDLDRLTMKGGIYSLIKDSPMSVKELAEILEAKPASVAITLNRMKKANQVVSLPDSKWGLLSREEN